MGLELRCIKCLYFSCLLNIGLTQLKNHSGSLHYMGEFSYRNALSFIKGNQSCDVPSQNFSSILKREVNDQNTLTLDYTCLLFLDDDLSEDRNALRIRDVNVEIHEYDIRYKFKLNPFDCTFENKIQNVNLFLTCFQQKDYVAKACKNGKGCDDDLELCQHYRDFQKSICIPKRKYNESCGMHSQCYKNTICTQTERRKFLCLCKEGFEFINGDCLKVGIGLNMDCNDSQQCTGGEITTECVYNASKTRHVCSCKRIFIESNGICLQKNRRLYEPCESSLQCRGTHGATECRYVGGIKLCYCPDGYDIIEGTCLKVGIEIGESCYLKQQCTGTQNAHQCQPYNKTGIMICQCNFGFMRYGDQCLQANRMLYEDCILHDQCNGTSGASVCQTVRDIAFCLCASNYIEDKNKLRCRKAKKSILESCKIDEQCTGTENAGVCRYDEQMERGVCACNEGYIWHKEKCIKSNILLFESCEYDVQCNGTEAADICKTFGERQICYCKPGHLEFQGRCIEGKKHLGEQCETNKQCLRVEDNVICGQNSSCSCQHGYIKVGQECVKATRKMFESCQYDMQCTGTPNASKCKPIIGDITICVCSVGHFEYNGTCFEGEKKINDSCEIDLQCNGTKHAGVCGENLTCICEPGFLMVNELQNCIQAGNLSLGQSCVESSQCTGTENSGQCVDGQCSCDVGFHLYKQQCIPGKKHMFLLVGAGVFLLLITVSIMLCIIVCRRKLKVRSGRLVVNTADNVPEDHNYYTYAIHGNIRDTKESQIPLSHNDCSYTGDTLYHTTHHAEEQTTENLYDVSEPLSTLLTTQRSRQRKTCMTSVNRCPL